MKLNHSQWIAGKPNNKPSRVPVLLVLLITSLCLLAGTAAPIRIKAVGLASPRIASAARARATALRAAKVMGYKKLALAAGLKLEQAPRLKGVRVTKITFISDYKVEIIMEMHRAMPTKPKTTTKPKKKSTPKSVKESPPPPRKSIPPSAIADLNKEMKTIEAQITELDGKVKELKKRLEVLQQKIKTRESPK